MLLINNQLFEIEDAIDDVIKNFLELEIVKSYQLAKNAVLSDNELQSKIVRFQEIKSVYDDQKDYIAFRPEVKKIRREMFQQKRAIDLNEKMIDLRRKEVDLQKTLAEISQKISSVVSGNIFVDTGLPLASHKEHHGKGRGDSIKERGDHV
jgi:cell fate (sporulation/competence/biofilm development) regulator YlbF (YheA/YmcA/DUF963 family)